MVDEVVYHFGKQTGGVWLEAGSVPAKKVVKNGKDLYYILLVVPRCASRIVDEFPLCNIVKSASLS